MLYGPKYWALKKQHPQEMSIDNIRMLKWMSDNVLKDEIRNKCICQKLEMMTIRGKRESTQMIWTRAMYTNRHMSQE